MEKGGKRQVEIEKSLFKKKNDRKERINVDLIAGTPRERTDEHLI